ncbi:glycosyltransferase [Rufibacter psychrotolerans]|uniref:glycosyltransferase n=1 Tax=Rufibacter psychrotolerans TaxID=2812556 RepID=UPI00196811AD|nr:glycosyltransferase family 2 protein [Rufibacter sp. SYSU D00308]
MILTAYSILITLFWVALMGYLVVNSRKVKFLKDVVPALPAPEPSVAIIIAVKDEEANLEAALRSVCGLTYQNLTILVINDRSTDRTPEILSRMAQQNPALQVLTVRELPPGWLGKNHALYQGYGATASEWLLFTDADVLFHAGALQKAMTYAVANQLDHLTLFPQITSRSGLFRSVINTFALMLETRQRPWDVPNPASDASLGIGAFNLLRRSAYEKAGTHTAFSLRPDDDLKLGERIKAAGLRQEVLYGVPEVSLEWYTSLGEFVRGLMKNTFSVFNYHWPTALSMALLTLLVFVLPLPVMLLRGEIGLLLAAVLLLAQILLMVLKTGTDGKWWHALLIPFAGAVMVYILLASAYKTLRQGGIYWRNSFYPLSELKKQR